MIKKNKHFLNGKFHNLITTRLGFKDSEGMGKAMKTSFFGDKKIRSPQSPIQNIPFNTTKFLKEKNAIAWFGHSSLALRVEDVTIIVDPVFQRASPFSFIGPKPFSIKHQPQKEHLPKDIDVLLLTHDHYDHLEKETIKYIHKNVNLFLVPLKIKAILIKWGVPEHKIIELDWYETTTHKNISFTCTPSRHFSGRGLLDRQSTLWCGWIIKSKQNSFFHSGDGGYSSEFKKIGKEHGPFNFAFLENGQYDKAWEDIHMYPEKSVQAGIDIQANVIMPIHWGKYDLSVHPWKEPIQRFTQEAKKKKLRVALPRINEIFTIKKYPTKHWWEKEN